MELAEVTVQDCIDMCEKKGMESIICHGKVMGFTGREGRHMGFLLRWDTPMKTIPAEKAKEVPAGILEKMQKQGQVWSLHPQCPKPVTYVGTKVAGHGFVNDYYVDEQGVYWHESRLPEEPVVLKFIYGGGVCTKKHKKRSRTA